METGKFKFKSKFFGEQWLESTAELKQAKHYEQECLSFLRAYGLSIKNAEFYLHSFLSYQFLKHICQDKYNS